MQRKNGTSGRINRAEPLQVSLFAQQMYDISDTIVLLRLGTTKSKRISLRGVEASSGFAVRTRQPREDLVRVQSQDSSDGEIAHPDPIAIRWLLSLENPGSVEAAEQLKLMGDGGNR